MKDLLGPALKEGRKDASPSNTAGSKATDQEVQTAIANVSRFNRYKRAEDFMYRQKNTTGILHGDNDKYWVPATNRQMSILQNRGYERADNQ